jgi:hypothetical protein
MLSPVRASVQASLGLVRLTGWLLTVYIHKWVDGPSSSGAERTRSVWSVASAAAQGQMMPYEPRNLPSSGAVGSHRRWHP